MPRYLLCLAASTALLTAACDGDDPPELDAGTDAGSITDAGTDASVPVEDAAGLDAGIDAGEVDEDGGFDAGPFDAGPSTGVTFPARDFRCAAGTPRPCTTTDPVTTEAERTIDVVREMSPTTYTFVIHAWSMPEPSFTGTAAGFNLDALDSGDGSTSASANCEEFTPDFESLRDTGHVGVDNAFGTLVPTIEGLFTASDCPGMTVDGCLDATFAENIADGTFLMLVELTGVESLTYDASVEVTLYSAVVADGRAPLLGSDGRLAPGQTFETVEVLAAPTDGDIFQGRLRVRWPGRIELPAADALLLPLQLDAPELRATLTAAGLELGVVGATTEIEYLVSVAEATMPGIGDTVRAVLESIADIDPSTADPFICERLSTGYFFDATSATRR